MHSELKLSLTCRTLRCDVVLGVARCGSRQNPHLANTFKLLASKGKAGFYAGPVAEAIVKLSQELGGTHTMDDLKAHTTDFVEPIHTNYKVGSACEPSSCPFLCIPVCVPDFVAFCVVGRVWKCLRSRPTGRASPP